jgi:hypothetical protein
LSSAHDLVKSLEQSTDDDGTLIQSLALRSCLVWDHDKHKRHFMHDEYCLPILHLNTGLTYYQAFCSRITKSYQDAVHFAFSLVHSKITDKVETPLCSCKGAPQAGTLDAGFVLGQHVLYEDGEGNQKRVVYKGATPDGQWHTLK